MPYFHLMKNCMCFVFWVTRLWEQYIETWLAKNTQSRLLGYLQKSG
uniref:Uncharacterized protein n=1 Tax=Arundo donax TaxID=35708 RepID=A0A0A8XYJ7_ARUDO